MFAQFFIERLVLANVMALVIMLLPVILIALQPDLGTALLIAASGGIVLLLAGIGWR